MRKLILVIIILLTINTAYAATIHGTIYDLSLNKVNDVIVKINTVPEQTFVSKDVAYSFIVQTGDYIVTARYSNSYIYNAKEVITIKDDGDYVIDLFLFPSFEEEEELIEDINFNIEDLEKKSFGPQVIGIIFILIIIIFIIILYKRKIKIKKSQIKEIKIEEKREEIKSEDYYSRVYEIIKKEKRTTQKDIRKQIPLSEAKISLIITQLEHEGKIKKIKKGRGNIVILK